MLQQLEDAHEPGSAARGEADALHAANADEIGAECECLHDVCAAADPAVDDDPRPPADRVDDLRQHLERAAAMVELTAAVVRDVDDLDAVLDREARVLVRRDPLEDQRQLRLAPEPLDVGPGEPRLVLAAGDVGTAEIPLRDVALAAAVD